MGRVTKEAKRTGLTDQQELFCREYVARGCRDAASAGVAAGFSARSAKVTASRLLTKANVQVRIDELIRPIIEKLDITAEAVLQETARIAFSRIDRVLRFGPDGVTPKDSDQLSENALATVAEASQTVTEAGGSIRIKLHDKLSALEKLGRHLKLWNDKVEVQTPLEAALAGMTSQQMIERTEVLRASRLAWEAEKRNT